MSTRSKPRLALLIVATLVAALAGIIGLLHTQAARGYLLQRAQEHLRDRYGIALQAASLDYNLFGLTARLDRVQIYSIESPESPRLFQADSMAVDIGLLAWLRQGLTLEDVRIEGGDLQIIVDSNGVSNLPRPLRVEVPETSEASAAFLIQSLTATGPRLFYNNQQQNARVELSGWRLQVEGETVGADHRIQFETAQPGSADIQGRSLDLAEVNLSGAFGPDRAQVDSFRLVSSGSSVTLSGAIDNFSDPAVDLDLKADLDTQQAANLTQITVPVEGRLQADVQVDGPVAALTVTLKASSPSLSVGEFRNLETNIASSWNRQEDQVAIETVSIRSAEGGVRLAGQVSLTETGHSHMNAEFERLNLRLLTRQFNSPIRVASTATGAASATWPGLRIDEAEGDVKLRLARSQAAPQRSLVPVAGSLTASSRNGDANISIESLEALGAEIHGEVALPEQQGLHGDVQGAIADLKELVAGLDAVLGKTDQDSVLPTPVAGPASFSALLAGTVDRPEIAASFEADTLHVGAVEDVALLVNADYNPDRVLLREARVTWSGQTLTAGGTVGFQGAATTLDLQAQTQQASLASILEALNQTLPVEGTVTASASISGTTDAPLANVDISATGLVAYQEQFGDLRANATLQDQRLDLVELRLDKPNDDGTAGFLQATGNHNLDSKEYAFEATSSDLKLARLVVGDGNTVKGVINLRASGSGTADEPRLNVALDAESLTVDDREIGAASLAGVLEGKQASLAASIPKFRLTGTANVGTEAPYPVEFKLNAEQTDLAALDIKLKEDELLAGVLAATIEGSGELDNWQDGAAQAVISNLEINAGKQQVRNDGPLALRYGQRMAGIDGTLVMDDSRLRAQGSLPLERTAVPGTVEVDGDINLDKLVSLIPTDQPTAAQGRLELKGSLAGSLQNLDPSLDLTVRRAGFFNPAVVSPFLDVNIDARYEQGALELTDLRAEWAGAKISGNGTLPMGLLPVDNLPLETPVRQGPALFQLSVQGLIVDSISDLPLELGGTISLTTNLEAPTLEAESITGKIVFDELRFNYENFEIQQESPATLSFNQGRFQIESFTLAGPDTKLQASGGATLGESNAIEAKVEGSTDIGVLTLASDAIAARGRSQFDLAIGGRFSEPSLNGHFVLENAQLNLDTPSVQLQDLNVKLTLAPERIAVEQMAGSLNGGAFDAGGNVSYKGLEVGNVDLSLSAQNVFLDYPEGLDTLLDSKLQIRSRDNLIVVGGNVQILEASYSRPVEINQLLFDYLRSGESIDFVAEPDPLLSRVRYAIDISNTGPIIIDNNLAELAADANLRLTGTYYRPGLTGRLSLQEGGELLLAENRYVIERGTIDFGNETRIQPSVDIVARTQVRRRYDIELQINGGGPVPIATTLTSSSHPELSEPDLISLLLTGREREDLRGQETTVAARQSLSLITGQIGGRISRGAQRALGLSEVRIEPNLIAAESDPGARLTVGQNLTADLSLVYSMNLADSSDQIWIARYDLTRRFQAEAVKQEDNSYRTEFRHDVRFGGAPDTGRARARRPPEIASVDFQNQFGLSREELRDKLGLKPGKAYDFFKLRRGAQKLERSLAQEGFLESTVRVRRQNKEDTASSVDLVVEGDLGPQVEMVFEGTTLPSSVRDDVRKVWRDGIFELQRVDDAVKVIRRYIAREGHFEAKVDHSISGGDTGAKRVVFNIRPGPKYRDVALRFTGNSAFAEDELRDLLDRAKLQIAVHVESQQVTDLLTQSYRQQGYLDVKVAQPEYKLDASTATGEVVIAIEEGPQYRVAGVSFTGNRVLPEATLRSVLPFGVDHIYRPEFLREALNRLEERYWQDGYNDVVVNFQLTRSTNEGAVQVAFDIEENKQGIIKNVTIAGNDATSSNLVRSQLNIAPDEPLNFEKLGRSRKNLYDTGAYALVDIKAEPVQAADPSIGEGQKPLELQVRLREVKPYQIRYGAFFDTERGPGIIADLTNRNILGSARVVGLRTRYDADEKEARLYFSQPLLRRLPLRSTALLFVRRQDQGTFITDTKGFSLLQEARFRDSFILNYGYRYERNHTFEKEPDPFFPFDERVSLAPLTATLSRETRDDLLDATRGSFTSHAVSYAATSLGSDLGFLKYFGQYFRYIPLVAAREDPYSGPAERPRLVYAGGVRVGLAKGLGGLNLVTSERFFAGGGTSIRGFAQDAVGPTFFDEPGEDPTGGDAVFILNNELRFPLISIFDGVGFVDIGNVYKRASDFNPFEVRKAAGVGLRVRTPYFLLRADYGFKLDRRPGESLGSFFFSIGQAF